MDICDKENKQNEQKTHQKKINNNNNSSMQIKPLLE